MPEHFKNAQCEAAFRQFGYVSSCGRFKKPGSFLVQFTSKQAADAAKAGNATLPRGAKVYMLTYKIPSELEQTDED